MRNGRPRDHRQSLRPRRLWPLADTGSHQRLRNFLDIGARIEIVGKDAVRSKKDVVFDAHSRPHLNAAFDGNTVANTSAKLNEDVLA